MKKQEADKKPKSKRRFGFLRFLISWQLWLSILLFALISYGIYYFVFQSWLYKHTRHNKEVVVPNLADLDLKTAIFKLDSIGLTYDIDSIKFDSTKTPNRILSYYPLAGTVVKEGRRVFIKSNPSTWLPVELPDLVNKSNRLAFTQLKISGLEVGDTLYEPDIAKNVVLKVLYDGRIIKPGFKLPRFSKVDLVLGSGPIKDIPVPTVLDMPLSEAKKKILDHYLEVGMIEYYGAIKDSANANVFFQDPRPNDLLDQGFPINLWVTDSLITDIEDKIAELREQTKSIFEQDSASIERYINRQNNQSVRNLDVETRRQLEGSDEPTETTPRPSNNNRSKPKSDDTDGLIVPDIR